MVKLNTVQILINGGLQPFGEAMCSPNVVPVNGLECSSLLTGQRLLTQVPKSFLTGTVTGNQRLSQDLSCNSTSAQMTMKPQVMDQSQGHGYETL